MKNINSKIYMTFDLSAQAIVRPSDNVKCLYFNYESIDDSIKTFRNVISCSNNIYLCNGYRSIIQE